MVTFQINDMSCGGCAGRIGRALAAVDKDARVEFSITERLVRIGSAVPASTLAQAIRDAGYTPERVAPPSVTVRPRAGGCCGGPNTAVLDSAQKAAASGTACCG